MRYVLGVMLLALAFQQLMGGSGIEQQARETGTTDTNAVVQAIQDEIYDYGYQKEFFGFETAGPRGPEAAFNIYIEPKLTPETGGYAGSVIYKYLPFGEVIRTFMISADGTVYLSGDPDSGFPSTQPNTRTVYLDDDELCRDKHDWKKIPFELDLTPSTARLNEAIQRQKKRTGFSHRELSKTHRQMPKP